MKPTTPLSPAQLRAMRKLADGHVIHWPGARWGVPASTAINLHRRGYVGDDGRITEAGLQALARSEA